MQIPGDSSAILRTMRAKQGSLMVYPSSTIFHYFYLFYFIERTEPVGEIPTE